MRQTFRPACPRPSALDIFCRDAGSRGASRLSCVSSSLSLWSSRGLASAAPATAILRSAQKKLSSDKKLSAIEKLTAAETYEVLQARFVMHGAVRSGFVTNLFHKVESTDDLDRAFEAFYYAQSRLVEPNEHMLWELQNACVRVGEPRRALDLYADVQRFRVWPLARHFNRLMRDFLAAGDAEGAVLTFAALQAREVAPTAQTFALLVRAHAEQGDEQQALVVAAESKSVLGVDALPAPVADVVLGLHWKARNVDALRALVAEQVPNNATRSLDGALYAALAHLQAQDVATAADLVRAALTHPPPAERFEKWADTLAEEASSAQLAQPAAALLRAIADAAPADARAQMESLASTLEAVATPEPQAASEEETVEEQPKETA